MFSQDKLQEFMSAATRHMMDQIIPSIFSNAQRAEMKEPYHSEHDHYHCSFSGGNEFRDMEPQISIEDPRISAKIIEQAIKKVSFQFDGQDYEFDVRVYKGSRASKPLQQWQDALKHKYISREAIEKLEPGLKQQFQLASGADYHVSYGTGRNNTASFTIFVTQNADAKRLEAIRQYADAEMKKVITDRPVSVSVSGDMPRAL